MDGLNNELPKRLREGDSDAWSELYDQYAPRVWQYTARRMGGSAADVGDVVQEVFLAAAESAGRFDPSKGTLWAWLIGIAKNTIARHYKKKANHLRDARRWWRGLNGVSAAWIEGSGDAPDSILESGELAELVRAALAELPEDYQTLLVGKYLDLASGEDMARQTGVSPQAIRAKLYRARAAFRRCFLKLAGDDALVSRSPDHE